MRRIREILRLCWGCRLSMRQAAESVGVSSSTVSQLLRRAEIAGLSWPLNEDIDDSALERIVFPPPNYSHNDRHEPDWHYVHQELSKKGVTLSLLWQETKEANPNGYQFTQFCERYRRWRKAQNITLRQVHKAGEKTFSDFAGKTLKIKDPVTGQESKVYLFVTTLGASNYSYAEGFLKQDTEAWSNGHVSAFEYFGGAPRVIVPDNPKAAVISASNYEPVLNESFRRMAAHYGCAVLPARVRKPKDKAKVESAVGLHERWIIARLRNRTFFTLPECNEAIWELLEQVNARAFQKLPDSRRIAFETIEKPALQPLPQSRFEFADCVRKRVGMDYHVEFERHWYSVPHALAGREVELRATSTTIEVLYQNRRIASHARSAKVGAHTTLTEHLSPSHRAYVELTDQKILAWAAGVGASTFAVVQKILDGEGYSEEKRRRCSGIVNLRKQYPPDRIEAACKRALHTSTISYRSIKSILQHRLDAQPLTPVAPAPAVTIIHENLRGPEYFTTKENQSC